MQQLRVLQDQINALEDQKRAILMDHHKQVVREVLDLIDVLNQVPGHKYFLRRGVEKVYRT